MKRVKVYANFEEALDPVIMVESDKDVEIIIDYLIPDELPKPIPPDTIRFVLTIQPEQHFNDLIRRYQDNFHHLLTFMPSMLSLPKAIFFIGLTPFCTPDPSTEKTFGVSCVFSGRNCLPGHKLRHELWQRQNEIRIPRYFYTGLRSGQTGGIPLPVEKKAKNVVMDTMFHIAIDSYDYDNSFSEKLIDPLIRMSLPIYWGAHNVLEYFNPLGILHVSTVSDIINACNSLTPDDYLQRLPAIRENFATGMNYYDYGKQLQRIIQKVLNERQ
jgi:hypothetical protein